MKKRVFVSHPFAGDPINNMKKVDKICKDLDSQGYLPISPLHLFSYKMEDSDRELIMQTCFKLIDFCDIVFIYGDSKGCMRELEYAIETNKEYRIVFKGEII